MRLLDVLLNFLFPPRQTESLLREADSDALMMHCAPISVASFPYATTALFSYTEPLVRACVVEAKFHRSEKALQLLAGALREYLMEWCADQNAYASRTIDIVPIPLGQERKRARGYNQVEEMCTRALVDFSGKISLEPHLLKRVKETVPQTELNGKARRTNMRGAFCAAHEIDPNRTYLVIDDVTTTGATLEAAVSALQHAGAVHIFPLALAH